MDDNELKQRAMAAAKVILAGFAPQHRRREEFIEEVADIIRREVRAEDDKGEQTGNARQIERILTTLGTLIAWSADHLGHDNARTLLDGLHGFGGEKPKPPAKVVGPYWTCTRCGWSAEADSPERARDVLNAEGRAPAHCDHTELNNHGNKP